MKVLGKTSIISLKNMKPNRLYTYDNLKSILGDKLQESGFFEDGFNDFDSLPNNGDEIIEIYNSRKKELGLTEGTVLIICGCFAPIHNGHYGMADLYSSKIDDYVMTIFYPAHDSYVETKTDKWNINNRKEYFYSLGLPNHYYFDTYPAEAYNNDINFTYLVSRVRLLLPNSNICFLHGSDNFGFMLSFYNTDIKPVCFKRDKTNYEIVSDLIKKLNIEYDFIDDNPNFNVSSTKIRNGEI